jgi:hypothetical protein
MKKAIAQNGLILSLFLLVMILLLAGCANREAVTECLKGHTYGFWGGLWHGIIAPIDLIAMLWRDDVSVFAPNNNGAWYAFGFIIGSGGWGFLGGNRASKKYKNK